jgi:hypothetical protein
MLDIAAIQHRVEELDEQHNGTLADCFGIVAREFNIPDANDIAELLGCRCPFGLIGYLQAMQEG